MPKNRVLYNCQAVYVGPSPASGYHFIDGGGELNNKIEKDPNNYNLIKKIHRITNLDYSINLPRESIKQLGKSSLASYPVLNSPNVQVNFEYYLNGVSNEARLGFYVNHEYTDNYRSGIAIQDNFNTFLFSGLNVYDENILPTSPFWPGNNRSNRNIFALVTKQENEDEISRTATLNRNEAVNVIAFGDGYITNYDTSCSVGTTPKVKVGFICDNVIFYTGSSGLGIPSINPKTLEVNSGIKFVIPEEIADTGDNSIILPGDITIDIQRTGSSGPSVQMDNIDNFGVKFSDIKIQDYNISIKFNREDMTSIGYRAPHSRRINLPIEVNFGFNALVGDESVSNLSDMIKTDDKYNITIRMKDRFSKKDLVRYDFRKACSQDFAYTSSIEDNRNLDFNFRVNCSPDNLSEGLFISGQLSNILPVDLLLEDSGIDFIVDEEGDQIIINFVPPY